MQGFGISVACSLKGSGLSLQAGQFLVAELDADQLSLGFVGEFVGVVFDIIDFDGGHIEESFYK